MDYLLENLSLIYKTSGWSYDTLSLKMKEGVPEKEQFSKDQVRSYEKRLSAPKPHFKKVLANFLGVDVNAIVERKLTVEEIENLLNKKFKIDNSDETHEVSDWMTGEQTYLEQRQMQKLYSEPLQVPLVPIAAQAGYKKRYNQTDFLNELKSYPILPGVDPHGAIWRYFQVDGDSMLPFLNSGDYVLSNQVPKEDWPEVKDYQVYVIVTEDLVTIKRVFKRKHFKELVLIPENEVFPQKVISTEQIKEIWRYRRHIGWNASSPKKFEIKV